MADVCELMQRAIHMAEEREAFYCSDAAKSSNPLAARTFAALAQWEGEHRALLASVYESAEAADSCPMLEALAPQQREMIAECGLIFDAARASLEGEPTCEATLLEAYAFAMARQREAINLWSEALAEAQSDAERELYGFLLAQERDKLNLLATTEEYLSDTIYWNFRQEMWIVTG